MNGLPDERAGAAWWNGLTDAARAFWTVQCGGGSAADAWALYKIARCDGTGIPLRFCTCSWHTVRVPVPA